MGAVHASARGPPAPALTAAAATAGARLVPALRDCLLPGSEMCSNLGPARGQLHTLCKGACKAQVQERGWILQGCISVLHTSEGEKNGECYAHGNCENLSKFSTEPEWHRMLGRWATGGKQCWSQTDYNLYSVTVGVSGGAQFRCRLYTKVSRSANGPKGYCGWVCVGG